MATPLPVPAGGVQGSGWVNGMTDRAPACSESGICVAGVYEAQPETTRSTWMLVAGSGSSWKAETAPVPPDGLLGSAYPLGEACSPGGFCAVTGIYHRPG